MQHVSMGIRIGEHIQKRHQAQLLSNLYIYTVVHILSHALQTLEYHVYAPSLRLPLLYQNERLRHELKVCLQFGLKQFPITFKRNRLMCRWFPKKPQTYSLLDFNHHGQKHNSEVFLKFTCSTSWPSHSWFQKKNSFGLQKIM